MKNTVTLLTLLICLTCGLQAQKLTGKASYYADRFHGKPTSTGETYDKNSYTAASKEFPVGTVLRVTNVANNLVTQVRVNDCGPNHPDRILDLSKAAATQIDLLRAGVAVVQLEVLAYGTEGSACDRSLTQNVKTVNVATPPPPAGYANVATPPVATPPAPPADPNASLPTGNDPIFYLYGVQVAAYGKSANADAFIKKSGNKYGFLFKRTDAKHTRVFVGPYLTEVEAEAKLAALKKDKVDGIVRRVQ